MSEQHDRVRRQGMETERELRARLLGSGLDVRMTVGKCEGWSYAHICVWQGRRQILQWWPGRGTVYDPLGGRRHPAITDVREFAQLCRDVQEWDGARI